MNEFKMVKPGDPSFDDDLDRRLQSVRPETPPVSQHLVEEFISQAAQRRTPSRPKRKKWSVLAIVSCIAGGLIAAPVAAVAIRTFEAQTGEIHPADPGTSTGAVGSESNPSDEGTPGAEWIDMGASDAEEYMASMVPTQLPLPAGSSWEAVAAQFLAEFSSAEYAAANQLGDTPAPVIAQSSVIALMWEGQARRAWLRDWFEAHEELDRERMRTAGTALAESVDWPAEVAASGGAYADETRQWMLLIGEGDSEAAQAYAGFSLWTDLWDGEDRSALAHSYLSGLAFASPGEVR